MATRQDAAEFMEKAREYGLIADMERELEERKNVRRLVLIAKIKELPAEAKTELPTLGKATTAAYKTLELAEEAYRTADRNYKELSTRLYGVQLQFDGARLTLEREAAALMPDFLREAWEDLGILDGLVSAQFRYEIESVSTGWFGRETQTTSNGAKIQTCRANIKNAHERVMAMTLESTSREVAQADVATILAKVEKEAYAIGVSRGAFADRRKPVDVQQQTEDYVAKEDVKRRNAIASLQV